MGYNGYDNRRGYNGGGYRNNGYRNNGYQGGGYPQPGYQPNYQPQQPFQNPEFPFDIGQVVIHKATGEELTVIRFGREQVECRLPNLNSNWFYVHELVAKEAAPAK